jgi:Cdc6-like AAA superfamily ATPase
LPRTIIDRENKQDAIASYLKDIMLMKTSKVLYIHGFPGVGKSTVVRAVLSQFLARGFE